MDPELGNEESRVKSYYENRLTDRGDCFHDGELFMLQEKEHQTISLLKKNGIRSLEGKRILDIGCGTGDSIREFIRWGASPKLVSGVDLMEQRIALAKELCPPSVSLECCNASHLPFPDESFDIVSQSTVFSSVKDPSVRRQIASEMLRVLSKEGFLLWYDLRVGNPKNKQVAAVKRSEILSLFPGCPIVLKPATLAPLISRLLAERAKTACVLLSKFAFLRTHFLGIIRKKP